MSYHQTLHARYAAIQQRLYYSGSPEPKSQKQESAPVPALPCDPPVKLLGDDRGGWRSIVNEVTLKTGVTFAEMRSESMAQYTYPARKEAYYRVRQEAKDALGGPLSYPELARIFRKHHTTIVKGAFNWARENGLPEPR